MPHLCLSRSHRKPTAIVGFVPGIKTSVGSKQAMAELRRMCLSLHPPAEGLGRCSFIPPLLEIKRQGHTLAFDHDELRRWGEGRGHVGHGQFEHEIPKSHMARRARDVSDVTACCRCMWRDGDL